MCDPTNQSIRPPCVERPAPPGGPLFFPRYRAETAAPNCASVESLGRVTNHFNSFPSNAAGLSTGGVFCSDDTPRVRDLGGARAEDLVDRFDLPRMDERLSDEAETACLKRVAPESVGVGDVWPDAVDRLTAGRDRRNDDRRTRVQELGGLGL